MGPAVVAVGETVTEISLPAVAAVWVLNSSGGLGDADNAPDVVVNTGAPAALTPQQVGCRLKPGEGITFPLRSPGSSQQLGLYAVAAGPGAQLELELLADNDRW